MAPSGLNRQPWYFYVVNDLEKNRELGHKIEALLPPEQYQRMKSLRPKPTNVIFYDAPCVIYGCIIKDSADYAAFDLGLACQNLMLEAESLGLATVPLKAPLMVGTHLVKEVVPMNPDHEVYVAIAVGYRAPDNDDAPKPRKTDYATFV